MLIMRNLNLISVHFWTYLLVINKLHVWIVISSIAFRIYARDVSLKRENER